MLLNTRQSADPLVVGESFVVPGNQARCVYLPEVLQDFQAEVTIEKDVFLLRALLRMNDQGGIVRLKY